MTDDENQIILQKEGGTTKRYHHKKKKRKEPNGIHKGLLPSPKEGDQIIWQVKKCHHY